MFDTIALVATAPVATLTNVVSHDKSADPVTPAIPQTAYQSIETLMVQRQVWEDEVLRTSNDRLYSILQDCYALYVKASTRDEAKALNDALAQHANLKGFYLKASAHTLTKIVKCVFGADRRRASAYRSLFAQPTQPELNPKIYPNLSVKKAVSRRCALPRVMP